MSRQRRIFLQFSAIRYCRRLCKCCVRAGSAAKKTKPDLATSQILPRSSTQGSCNLHLIAQALTRRQYDPSIQSLGFTVPRHTRTRHMQAIVARQLPSSQASLHVPRCSYTLAAHNPSMVPCIRCWEFAALLLNVEFLPLWLPSSWSLNCICSSKSTSLVPYISRPRSPRCFSMHGTDCFQR